MHPREFETEDVVERLTDPDPFDLPRRLRQQVRSHAAQNTQLPDEVDYLWLHVSKDGIGSRQADTPQDFKAPDVEQWMNVVDEAAALGVRWLVVTVDTRLTESPEILTVCQWAQDTHDIKVGLHTVFCKLEEEEKELLKQLDPQKTLLFAKSEALDNMRELEKSGIRLVAADPQPYGHRPNCQGPARLLFVDPRGVLYTCGLVEGKEEYRLGSVYENRFDKVIRDPELPHSVSEQLHRVSRGCDGCPSLVANFMTDFMD